MYVGAVAAAGAVVASGGTLAAVIVTATLAGGTGGIIGYRSWPNGSAIAMRIICRSRSIAADCCCG